MALSPYQDGEFFLRVGVMIDSLVPGSAPKIVGQEVRGLRALGYDAEAILLKSGYPPAYSFHLENVPMVCLADRFPGPTNLVDIRIPGFSIFSMHHIISPFFSPFVVTSTEWDMLVVHAAYTFFTAQSIRRTKRIPYLAFMGTEPFTYILPRIYSDTALRLVLPILMPLASFVQDYILRDCEAVITFSGKYHHLIRSYSDKPLEILPPGCFPVKDPNEKREDLILTYDRWHRWDIENSLNMFLEVLPRLSRKCRLVIAGHWHPPSIRSLFLRRLAKRGITDKVRILGALDERAIIDWCSRALVHVHANKEAFGMQSLEAAACGCPIVIPEGSGVTDLFRNGDHGYFPKEGDVDDFSECIDKLVSDPVKATKMGREAWKIARNYTWMNHSERLARIIEKYSPRNSATDLANHLST
jgi:glycosyltransferase involved in cell wall biosynthesis